MATEPSKSSPKHAHRMGAELAQVMGQMVSGQTLSMCSEYVLVKATHPAGRKKTTLAVKRIPSSDESPVEQIIEPIAYCRGIKEEVKWL